MVLLVGMSLELEIVRLVGRRRGGMGATCQERSDSGANDGDIRGQKGIENRAGLHQTG